jgi:hypothetical protein
MSSSISVRPKYRHEGASNFNFWKLVVMNILQDLELDHFVTIVVEEPTSNVGRVAFRRNQAKEKQVIFDYVKYNIAHVPLH